MRTPSLAAGALALLLLGGAASAQSKQEAPPSPCVGLEENACKANTACSWTRETTTKSGQKRKAYCRKKPTPQAKSN